VGTVDPHAHPAARVDLPKNIEVNMLKKIKIIFFCEGSSLSCDFFILSSHSF
jgi:hypothetical protein